jgi:hypothetical protein
MRDLIRPTATRLHGAPERDSHCDFPMTRAILAGYDFFSIEFTLDGERQLGFLSHDRRRDLFAIIYSVIEQGVEKRRTLLLEDDQIELIVYDRATELLMLV